MKVERSVEIARPHDEVWAVLRDPALMPDWFESFQSFATVLGDGTQVGDRFTIEYARDSGPAHLTAAVLELNEPDGHTYLFKGLPVDFTIKSELSDDGETTVWHATIEVKLSLVQKALAPMVKGTLDRLADDMADSFKKYVETQ